MKTLGLSPKTILAFLFPTLTTLGAVAVTYISTGELDSDALRLAAAGLVASVLAAAGAYIGKPGSVLVPSPGVASDDLLSKKAKARIKGEDGYGLIEVGVFLVLLFVALAIAVRYL